MRRCASCSRPISTAADSLLCARCLDWLAAALDPTWTGEPWPIPRLYARLSPIKQSGGDTDGRRAPGFRSTAPANTHALALTDPRSKANGSTWTAADGRVHREPSQGLLHAPTVLAGWLTVACDHLGEPVPVLGQSCGALALALLDRLDDVAGAVWLPDAAHEVRTLHNQLRTALASLTGEHRPRAIGRCPVTLGADERCNEPLYVPGHGDAVACRRCGSYWPRATWMDAAISLTSSQTA